LPTPLPRPRVEQKRSVFSVVLNAFMLVSALALVFIVLVREQNYAMGQKGPFADTIVQLTQQISADRSSDGLGVPPAN
jgi:hypothetical protein